MTFAGVVLAGGASRRMGRTKALLDIDGRAMADRVLDALRALGADPLFVFGGDPDELSVLDAPVVSDPRQGEGPVAGVLGVLEHLARTGPSVPGTFGHGPLVPGTFGHGPSVPGTFGHGPLVPGTFGHGPSGAVDGALILACDLADVTPDALRPVVVAAAGDRTSTVWVAATDRMEPMCALWSLSALAAVAASYAAGERALHRVIAEIPHVTVTVDGAALRNVNRPGDLPPSDAAG